MDITQFHAAFFEESREGLDAMEAGLLGLEESGRADAETVNTIFRAAHSIKGGAATFGFGAVTDLTHVLETLLDQARSGGRVLDREATGALLASVDVLRDLLAVYEQGGPDGPASITQRSRRRAPAWTGCWQEPLALRPPRTRRRPRPTPAPTTGASPSTRCPRCS